MYRVHHYFSLSYLKNKFETESQQKRTEFSDFHDEVSFFLFENHLLLIQALWPCDYTYNGHIIIYAP